MLSDIRRLVEESRQAGALIDFEMRVEHADAAPSPLGRNAYRIVQEALTNIWKQASGTTARVRVTGAPGDGLQISAKPPAGPGPHHTNVAGVRRRPARAA